MTSCIHIILLGAIVKIPALSLESESCDKNLIQMKDGRVKESGLIPKEMCPCEWKAFTNNACEGEGVPVETGKTYDQTWTQTYKSFMGNQRECPVCRDLFGHIQCITQKSCYPTGWLESGPKLIPKDVPCPAPPPTPTPTPDPTPTLALYPGDVFALIGGKDNKYCKVAKEKKNMMGGTVRKEHLMVCDSDKIKTRTKFSVEKAGDGKIAFKSKKSGLYCGLQVTGGGFGMMLICNKQDLEELSVEDAGHDKVAIKGKNGMYCSDGGTVTCGKINLGKNEKFSIIKV